MHQQFAFRLTKSIWKMLGPFATASRRTPMYTTTTTTTTRDRSRGPLWPHPIEWAQSVTNGHPQIVARTMRHRFQWKHFRQAEVEREIGLRGYDCKCAMQCTYLVSGRPSPCNRLLAGRHRWSASCRRLVPVVQLIHRRTCRRLQCLSTR